MIECGSFFAVLRSGFQKTNLAPTFLRTFSLFGCLDDTNNLYTSL